MEAAVLAAAQVMGFRSLDLDLHAGPRLFGFGRRTSAVLFMIFGTVHWWVFLNPDAETDAYGSCLSCSAGNQGLHTTSSTMQPAPWSGSTRQDRQALFRKPCGLSLAPQVNLDIDAVPVFVTREKGSAFTECLWLGRAVGCNNCMKDARGSDGPGSSIQC